MSTPLPQWPADLDHAVPIRPVTCRRCGRTQPAGAFYPSELRARPRATRAGTPIVVRASQRCRRCVRQAQRRYEGVVKPQRRYADEVMT